MSDTPGNPLVCPFQGDRYANSQKLSELLAPPYDVISEEQRRRLAARSEHNVVHLTLPQGGEQRYDNVKRLISEWRAASVIVRDREPSVYVVRQDYRAPEGHLASSSGVIAAVAAEPFSHGRIRPHVKTHTDAKVERLSLLRAANSTFEVPMFLSRDGDDRLGSLIDRAESAEPSARAVLDDADIKVWRVAGKSGESLAEAAGAVTLYLVDGHHRYEAVMAYRKECPAAQRLPGMVYPLGSANVNLLASHRILYGSHAGLSGVIESLQERFQVHEVTVGDSPVEHLKGLRDRGTACVVVLGSGSVFSLLLKAGAKLGDLPFANEPTVASLDVTRVDEIVVKPLLSAMGKTGRVAYSPDPDHVVSEVGGGSAGAAVMLNPPTIEQVLAVADAGTVMPQKATYFTPKVPSGIVGLSWEAEQANS